MKIAYKYADPIFMNCIRLFLASIFCLILTIATKRLKIKDIVKIGKDMIKLIVLFVLFQIFYSIGTKYLLD